MALDFLDARFDIREDDGVEADAAAALSEVPALTIPQVDNPSAFLRDAFANNPEKDRFRFAHGTTTLAFKFKGGIIVAVDSRASMGSYIGSGTVKKIIEINPFLCTCSQRLDQGFALLLLCFAFALLLSRCGFRASAFTLLLSRFCYEGTDMD